MTTNQPDTTPTGALSVDHLLSQLDVEIAAASAPSATSGWTTSGILLTLFPLIWLFITELGSRMNDPFPVVYNWLSLFLLISLFFDACTLFRLPRHVRFFPVDPRIRFQFTDLLNSRVSPADLLRYIILIPSLIFAPLSHEPYAFPFALIFYCALLASGVASFILENNQRLVMRAKFESRKIQISYVLMGVGFLAASGYMKPLADSLDTFRASDLLIAGLTAGLFYLLRILTMRSSTPYVAALEDVRYDLALANISTEEAKRRLISVKSGMTFMEAISDYAVPLTFLLEWMRDELSLAIHVMTPVEQTSHQTASVHRGPVMSHEKLWNEQALHYENFSKLLGEFNRFCKSRRLRSTNRSLARFQGRNRPVLMASSREELELTFRGLEGAYRDCKEVLDRYVGTRRDFADKVAEETGTTVDAKTFEAPQEFEDLPAIINPVRARLLQPANRIGKTTG
jgi:hypothetical protein